MKSKILAATVILAIIGASAHATIIYTFQQDDVDGYTGTRDTHLDVSTPDTSYGDSNWVGVDATYGDSWREDALLRFDGIFGNEPNQIPLESTIISATLTLYVGGTGGECGATVHRMLQTWDENVTWGNSFGGNGIDANEAVAASDAVVDGPPSGPLGINVTTTVQAWSDGADNYGWVFLAKPISTNGWHFHSSEYTADEALRPKLEVIIPEPATLLLFGLGGLAVLRKSRT